MLVLRLLMALVPIGMNLPHASTIAKKLICLFSYTILLFSQPTDFISPADFNPGTPVSTFTLTTYLQDSHMGPVVGVSVHFL